MTAQRVAELTIDLKEAKQQLATQQKIANASTAELAEMLLAKQLREALEAPTLTDETLFSSPTEWQRYKQGKSARFRAGANPATMIHSKQTSASELEVLTSLANKG